jgi:uncharacterized membrane protein
MFSRAKTASLLVSVLVALAPGSASAAPIFQGIGNLLGTGGESVALGVSGDGSVVVGWTDSASGQQAYRWTQDGGLVAIGAEFARAASYDGSVIVGSTGSSAFRWTASQGMVSLGGEQAFDVSEDGSVVVGNAFGTPFIWTASGTSALGVLPPGAISGTAWGMSGDGTVVAGRVAYPTGQGIQGYRWTAATGIVPLGSVPGDTFPPSSFFEGVSADGSTLVGSADAGAVAWAQGEGFLMLGNAGGVSSSARAASGDGSVIVGFASFLSDTEPLGIALRATVWDVESGNRLLEDILANDYGIDLAGWELTLASGISDDGRVIVGIGTNPDGVREGWIVTVPEPGTAVLLSVGLLVLGMRRARSH